MTILDIVIFYNLLIKKMKFLKRLLSIVIIVVVLLFGLFAYLGWLKDLVVFEVAMGPHTVAYVEHVWDYKTLWGPMGDLYDVLSGQNINADMWIGIFYDDPSVVEKNKLRSEGGVVIDKEDFQKLDLNSIDYKVKNLDKAGYAVITFPLKNMLSYMVWAQRAYPVLWQYLEDNNYSLEVVGIEMYDMENKLIYYMAETK